MERVVSYGVIEGRISDSGLAIVECLRGDGGRVVCEVVDAIYSDTRPPSNDVELDADVEAGRGKRFVGDDGGAGAVSAIRVGETDGGLTT